MLRPVPVLRSSSAGREGSPVVSASLGRRTSSSPTSIRRSISISSNGSYDAPPRRLSYREKDPQEKESKNSVFSFFRKNTTLVSVALLLSLLALHGGSSTMQTWKLWMENQALSQRLETISAKSEPLKALLDRLVAETPPGHTGRIELAHWKPSAYSRDEFAPPPETSLAKRIQHWIRTRKKVRRERRKLLRKERKRARRQREKDKKKGKKVSFFPPSAYWPPSEWFRRPKRKKKPYKRPPNDVCLVTKGTLDEFETDFLTTNQHWGGGASPSPVSVAVVVKLQRQLPFPSGDRRHPADRLAHFVVAHEAELEHVAIHLLLEYEAPRETHWTTKGSDLGSSQRLANLAIEHAGTDFVFFTGRMKDIPAPYHTHDRLKMTLFRNTESSSLSMLADRLQQERRVLIVPAWDVQRLPVHVPKSKPDLRSLAKQVPVTPVAPLRQKAFLVQDWLEGLPDDPRVQFPVNTTAPVPDDALDDHLFYETPFEPGFSPLAVIFNRRGAPPFRHSFALGNDDQDDARWFMELHRAGYKFSTLVQYFVARGKGTKPQNPALPTDISPWTEWQEARMEAFLDHLDDLYPLDTITTTNRIPDDDQQKEEQKWADSGDDGEFEEGEEGFFSYLPDDRYFFTFRKYKDRRRFSLEEANPDEGGFDACKEGKVRTTGEYVDINGTKAYQVSQTCILEDRVICSTWEPGAQGPSDSLIHPGVETSGGGCGAPEPKTLRWECKKGEMDMFLGWEANIASTTVKHVDTTTALKSCVFPDPREGTLNIEEDSPLSSNGMLIDA